MSSPLAGEVAGRARRRGALWLEDVQAVAQLQEREAQAPGAQLPNRESKEWFEYQHLWSNVEKTVQVTDGILQVSAHRRLS